ncbi:hypothetical protein [Piscinibacter sp.]|uniref:hypothetical protein n=1 Tax=Piscinibacter sp. TaxID=1903157 RepID=UPI002CBE9318|nr:hypothetical protein [Albitalea sp.]HUG21892.1 hypothetical protein [Albitalea sp.]
MHADNTDLPSRIHSPAYALSLVCAALALALGLWMWLPLPEAAEAVSEGSMIELATEVLYFVAAVSVWLLRRPGLDVRSSMALCVVLVAFGAREMDLHKHWTGVSMLKLSFFLGDAPLEQKLVSLFVVAVVALAAAHLLRTHAKPTFVSLRRGHSVALTVAIFIVTLLVAKTLDRSASVLHEDFGIELEGSVIVLVQAFEEALELALPMLVMLGLLQHRAQRIGWRGTDQGAGATGFSGR